MNSFRIRARRARWELTFVAAFAALTLSACQQPATPTPAPTVANPDALLNDARRTAEAMEAYRYYVVWTQKKAGETSRVEVSGQWTASGDMSMEVVPLQDDGAPVLDQIVDYVAVGNHYYKNPDSAEVPWQPAQSLDSRGLPPDHLIAGGTAWTLVNPSVDSTDVEHDVGRWQGEGYHFRGSWSREFEENGQSRREDIERNLYVSHGDMLVRVLSVSVRVRFRGASDVWENESMHTAVYTLMDHNSPVIVKPPDRVIE